jgi:hypothetical protein
MSSIGLNVNQSSYLPTDPTAAANSAVKSKHGHHHHKSTQDADATSATNTIAPTSALDLLTGTSATSKTASLGATTSSNSQTDQQYKNPLLGQNIDLSA